MTFISFTSSCYGKRLLNTKYMYNNFKYINLTLLKGLIKAMLSRNSMFPFVKFFCWLLLSIVRLLSNILLIKLLTRVFLFSVNRSFTILITTEVQLALSVKYILQ